MVYLDKYQGYMADNPNVEFVRCDGKVFAYDEVNTASLNNTKNMLTITGGQGNYPLAYIDTDSTLEFQFDIANFDMTLFELSNATNAEEGDYGVVESKRYQVEAGPQITLPYEVQEGSVAIRGLEEDTAAAAGKFKVVITASAAETAGSTVITLDAGDASVGDTIRVAYRRRVVNGGKVTVKTMDTTAKGQFYAHWPIYSAGTDCTEAAIKGWLHLYLPAVRVTALPGFSNSYKSAANTGITVSAMNPKRADGKMYDLIWEPTDANGEIVNKSSASEVDWLV